MVESIYYTTPYNQVSQAYNPNFTRRKILSKPIEKVQETIETSIEPFINPNEDIAKEKRRKKAIFAGSTVWVLGALTLMLNPRSSGKITSKLKSLRGSMKTKMLQSKDSFLKSKFYGFCHKIFEFGEKGMNMVFNFNSGKDLAIQEMCLNSNKKYPRFITKNERVNNIVRSIDDGFVKVFEKPHKAITKWFDKISQATVKRKYRSLNKKMDAFEILLKENKNKFSTDEWNKIEDLLAKISDTRADFSETKLLSRLKKQEDLMQGLDKKIWDKVYSKEGGFVKKSTEFWAHDLLKKDRLSLEREGSERISKLFSDKDKKGLYDEVVEIAKKNLTSEEFNKFDNNYKKVYQKLVKANDSECIK